jgi:hypothetical protein
VKTILWGSYRATKRPFLFKKRNFLDWHFGDLNFLGSKNQQIAMKDVTGNQLLQNKENY